MLKQLQEMFPHLIKATEGMLKESNDYKWFLTNENDIIGISQSELSQREEALLNILLTPYHANEPPTNHREKLWMDVLFHQEISKELMDGPLEKFQFVYFSFSDETVDPDGFREAIYGLFPRKTPILWENNHEGVLIIEGDDMGDDQISYSEIIEVLTTDFYMNIQFFVGPAIYEIKKAADFYQWIKKCYQIAKNLNHSVIHYTNAIPYLILHDLTEKEQQMIYDSILVKVKEDKELLKTVQVFLESNSNTTLAAKKMFMHRNSLQYRVDKFIEKTGIDVKQFDEALTVYLCLIMRSKWKES
ncbi:PucR C-terminal helix-turn-helix domain-containing protein [Gracilibacillus ureilyticus]|uniref:PucR C-terminal helix-turn-helix domain-containing protein n=1 Tax=Gracilibacillus ureilyticus TaxID=531814 RepID=A0A1H9SIE1_9BACI|nr:helix-turn-helix domain-containing protein [Gracilibacillus ureilyticus]SER84806.1 PucR C-terminal helix-turn-helix domain-containing protein [Gracilibacillus ureilyticus]